MGFQMTLDRWAQLLFVGGVAWVVGGTLGFVGAANPWLAFFTFWAVGSLLSMALAAQTLDPGGKAVLITGCDSGFGHHLALRLDALGFRVFACCLDAGEGGEGAKALREKGSPRLHVIQVDVTDEATIKAARGEVEKLLPPDEYLWGVVNNAGRSSFGNLEWVPLSMFKATAEVNLFGMISVTKAFLPLLRRRRGGRLINMASMLGRFGAPMRSPYVVSKFAVEGLSDSLRQELKPQGVDVIVIEPGNYIAGTSIYTVESVTKMGEEMWESMSEEAREFAGEERFREQIELMKGYITGGHTDISPVLAAIEDALTQKHPQARYQPAELEHKARIWVATHLPEWVHDLLYVGCLTQ